MNNTISNHQPGRLHKTKGEVKRFTNCFSRPCGLRNVKYMQSFVIGCMMIFTACGTGQQKTADKKSPALPTAAALNTRPGQDYPTGAVIYNRPVFELSLPGALKPYEQVAIYAKVPGFVQQLKVDIGDYVHKGQLLAVLEAPEMKQRYLSDKSTQKKLYSDYLYSKQAYERLVRAAATPGAVAPGELDQAGAEMQSAESAYQAAAAAAAGTAELQDYLQIRAPFSGIVTERNVSRGALTGSTGSPPLFMMAQKNKLRLTLTVPEKYAAAVQKGTTASFTVSSMPGQTFQARLSRSARLLNTEGRSLTLEFDVDNRDNQLQGGDYAQVILTAQRGYKTFWVPEQSVLNAQSGTYVMTLNKGIIKKVPVKEGVRLDSLTEIFGNIGAEDQVLRKPSEEIPEGAIAKKGKVSKL